MPEDIIILGIETSCDETAAALVKNGRAVLAGVISSQIPIHQKYGGVVPEIASREHIAQILPVIDAVFQQSGLGLPDIDAVAVTCGPGLIGALLVGLAAAKGLAFALDKPLIGVNHLEGHVFANFLAHPELEPPFVALVASGGHSSLLRVDNYENFYLLGETRDDAAGEAFDKVARVLNLCYPGGPEVEKLALTGNPSAIKFPRALNVGECSFSFSGLKSAVINYLHNAGQTGRVIDKADVAASFQAAVVDALVIKAVNALNKTGLDKLVLAGGVSANKYLRQALQAAVDKQGASLYYPPPLLCTDNAAMIACRGHYLYLNGRRDEMSLNAWPSVRWGSGLSGKR